MKKTAKILLYDIEITPSLGYVWGKWQQDVVRFKDEWYILSVAWKWLGQKRVYVKGLSDYDLYHKDAQNDRELVRELHKLFSEADVVIAHNGDAFDQKKSQARMLYHGLTPPAPYKQIDTMKVARKYFRFNSNKLDDLARSLKIGHKAQTGGFDTWIGCMNGNRTAWSTMKKYNKQDVELLEKVYLRMRPWIVNHPSLSLMGEKETACPKCGAGPLKPHKKRRYAKVGWAMQYQCDNCGGYSTFRKNEKTAVQFVN